MFNKFEKNDLVGYAKYPKSIPLGIVKDVEEKRGKAVVLVYVLDTFIEDEIGTVKCVPYQDLELISRPTQESQQCLGH
jgi:hypothetical protein